MQDLNLKITKRQKAFIQADADEILFGGAAGGGKSFGQLTDALLYALKFKGSRQLLIRRSFPDLERSLVDVHLKFYPLSVYAYNTTKHLGRFSNGSIIEFGYLEHENDKYQYQGAEYDVIRFDELTQFSEATYLYLFSRLRGVNAFPRSMRCSTNPGGVGHSWVKARFVDIGAPDVVHTVLGENGRETARLFLPSKIEDNPILMAADPDYKARLDLLPEKERLALRDGVWDLHDGQFFAEFRREKHVRRPFVIPDEWRRYVTMDYGMDMLAALWIAVDTAGKAYVYREVYEGRDNGMGQDGKGHIVSAAARRLKEANGTDRIDAWLAPPDLWNRHSDSGKSTADMFEAAGIVLEKTSNSRVSGWQAVHEWLADERQEDGSEAPKLKIFNTCPNIIRTLPEVQFDSHNPDDVANEPHELTHAPDALRGFCVYWSSPADKPPKPENFIHRYFHMEDQSDPLGFGDDIEVI